MNEKIPCDMIQDLLPLYVDGLTHEDTAARIKIHLSECDRCRETYEQMRTSIDAQADEQRQVTMREINYLKSLKKKNMRNMILGTAAAIFVIAAVAGAKLFLIGSPTESYMTTYVNADENQIHAGGMFYGSALVYAGHKIVKQEDGSQKLVIYACLASVWNQNGVFNLTLDMKDVDHQVQIGGITVMKDGTVISELANRLYKSRNPYIGDVSADGRLAGVLEIGRHLGSFTNELQTSTQPYRWTLRFEDGVNNSQAFEEQMKKYACVLLALTDNLGEVSWTYTAETEAGPVSRQGICTGEDAAEYLGMPVKPFGESPEKVEELLEKLRLP